MPALIRTAVAADAPKWIDLVKSTVGIDYPDQQVYDPVWVASQFAPGSDVETWVAEESGKLVSSASFLPPLPGNNNPVANIGRYLNTPEAYSSGAASALINHLSDLAVQRKQLVISRVFASDNHAQVLHEKAGFVCVGFQPFKHMHRRREAVLFYYRLGRPDIISRLPISESLPQISELASNVLCGLSLGDPAKVRDGAIGYPLRSEFKIVETTLDNFELWRTQAQSANPPTEISGFYNQGQGYFRIAGSNPPRALLAVKNGKYIAGIAYIYDEIDKCVRLIDSFAQDDLSMGAMLQHLTKASEPHTHAVYVEADVLMTAPRLMKTAEQLGFVPVAYLPAVYSKDGAQADVVKMIKLNMVYSNENAAFTTQSRSVAEIIDNNFQDQKVGVAIINLLRALPFFEGLGDGELRKIARLFTQKLLRASERVFNRGDVGNEAYVVMRGAVDIVLEQGARPIATIGNGQIFGEMAFLDESPRTAMAMASQPSIVLVIQREAFNDLVQHEPHLGMVVMHNIAVELTHRLRKAQKKQAA